MHRNRIAAIVPALAAAVAIILIDGASASASASAIGATPVVQPACGFSKWCAAGTCSSQSVAGVFTANLIGAQHNLTIYNGTDYQLPQTPKNLLWFMNVCAYTVSICGTGRGVAYYQNTLTSTDCHYIGTGNDPSTITYMWINPHDPTQGVSQHYTDGDSAGCAPGVYRSTTFNYHCDYSQWFTWTNAVEQPVGSCQYTVDVYTEFGCPTFVPDPIPPGENGGSSGLSGGSIFLIILLVVSFTYFVGGACIRRRMHNPQTGEPPSGRDLIPNREFWAALVAYTIDGCYFSYYRVSALLNRSGGGGGGGGSEHPYENIGAPTGAAASSAPATSFQASNFTRDDGLLPTPVAVAGQQAQAAAAKSVSADAPPPPSPYATH